MGKICAKMVPSLLNEGQKQWRVQMCQDILEQLEIWQSLKWKSALSPKPKTARMFKPKTKVMLITFFFDVHGIVHAEFLLQGQTINKHVNSALWERRELWETRTWLLYHDNAPAHNALGIREFLAKNNIAVWSNHPTLQIWPLVTSFCFPNSVKSSKKLVFKIQKPLKQPWRESPERSGGILSGVRGSVAEEIRKVHSSRRRILWKRHVVKFTCQIKENIYRPSPVTF